MLSIWNDSVFPASPASPALFLAYKFNSRLVCLFLT